MDDLNSYFLKKLDSLDKCSTYPELRKGIEGIKHWLLNGRHLKQHRTVQAFMTYLYNSYGDGFKTRKGYVSWLKCNLDFATCQTTKAIIDGETVIFKKYMVDSLSFADCTQKKHQKFFDDLQRFAMEKYKLDFNQWLVEYETNPALI